MNGISVYFQSKRMLFQMVLVAGLFASAYRVSDGTEKIKRLTSFERGTETCFSRVNQTYTAKIIGDNNSQYLTQNFEALTEECFAETVFAVDENFKLELPQVLKKLSTLSSNVHWFHEDLLTPKEKKILTNGEGRDVGTRFEKIENTKDEILDESETLKSNLNKNLGSDKNIFFIVSGLLVITLMMELLGRTKNNIANNDRENEAIDELINNGGINSAKIGEILRVALEQNGLVSCAKLFTNYYINSVIEKNTKDKNTDLNQSQNIQFANENLENEKIETIWGNDEIGINADGVNSIAQNSGENVNSTKSFSLDFFVSNAVDLLAEKMFSQGVQVIVKSGENIQIKGTDENIEQIIYHSINFAITKTSQGKGDNKIVTINAIKLGDVVAFDLIANGEGFDPQFLKNKVGLGSGPIDLDLDLKICESLLQEIEAKMQIDNRLNQNGGIEGLRIKMIFKSGTDTTKKLVDLKKGTRKEILSQIAGTV
jgi:hypothetical protein